MGPFVHRFDLAFAHVAGLPLYWYGAVYTVGFIGLWAWFRWRAERLGFSPRDVLGLSILIAAGCLVGGRVFDIVVYEWDYYAAHPWHALDWWRGGLATHGVMLGGVAGAALFARLRRASLAVLLDEVCVPAAVLMGVGRFGNFIEGGVVGSPTSLPWGVLYPDLDGARHPVAIYDGLKNLMLAVVLALVLRRYPAGRGVAAGLYLVLYAGLRFLIDLFRDYESFWGALGKGQYFNLVMLVLGVATLVWALTGDRRRNAALPPLRKRRAPGFLLPLVFVGLCIYPLGIPTSWTRVNIEQMRETAPPATPSP